MAVFSDSKMKKFATGKEVTFRKQIQQYYIGS